MPPNFTKQQLQAQALRDANPITPEQKMQMEMGDNAFELEIAPYLNYKSKSLDADNANYIGFEGDVPELGFQGFIGNGSDEPRRTGTIDGRYLEVPDREKGSVNAVDKGAKARTYAHEFRHLDLLDSSGRSLEGVIRAYDGYNAQNQDDWDEAVVYFGDYVGAESNAEAEKALLKQLKHMDGMKTDSMNDNPWWKRQKF